MYLRDWDLYQEKYLITTYQDNLITQYIIIDLKTLYFNYNYFLSLIFLLGMFCSLSYCICCSKKNKPDELQYQVVGTDFIKA